MAAGYVTTDQFRTEVRELATDLRAEMASRAVTVRLDVGPGLWVPLAAAAVACVVRAARAGRTRGRTR